MSIISSTEFPENDQCLLLTVSLLKWNEDVNLLQHVIIKS